MAQIILIRHGDSVLIKEKRFNGWDDIPLDEKSIEDMRSVGNKLLNELYKFDVLITSYLQRSIISGWQTLDAMNLSWIEEVRDWRLNPRHYGVLQGMTLEEAEMQYGKDRISQMQNVFTERPPLVSESDDRNPKNKSQYSNLQDFNILGESLEDVELRIISFFQEICVPLLEKDKKILITIHEDTFKVFMKYINGLSPEDTIKEHINLGVPVVLEYNKDLNKIETRLV